MIKKVTFVCQLIQTKQFRSISRYHISLISGSGNCPSYMDSIFELENLPGISSATARKMIDSGIVSIYDLATYSPEELIFTMKTTKDFAVKYISAAAKYLRENKVMESEFMSAAQREVERKGVQYLSTGSKKLDKCLLGGIETQAITEFYGEFGSGKSQLCHTIAANAVQGPEAGGLSGGVIVFDTEGTFRPERLRRISELRGYDADKVLDSVMSAKVLSAGQLEVMIKALGKWIEQFNAKLVIVDSISNLHRAEFPGRGNLADRQNRLGVIMHKLIKIAEVYKVAVVITNQVITDPGTMFGDPTKPVGGNVIGHSSTYRIYLRKSGKNRVAKIIDSPLHPFVEELFSVDESGVRDVEEEKTAKKEEKQESLAG